MAVKSCQDLLVGLQNYLSEHMQKAIFSRAVGG